ncbi:hypothetical protein [Parabacteroides goldsteinii]|nr:hypothetical protein [Parabacteroides goldsteinii]
MRNFTASRCGIMRTAGGDTSLLAGAACQHKGGRGNLLGAQGGKDE